MSSYENYSKTSASYDTTRPPQGLDVIRAVLSTNTVPLEAQTLLDAGCGTGQYTAALINDVAQLSLIHI